MSQSENPQFVHGNGPQFSPFQDPITATVLVPHQTGEVPVGVAHLDVTVRAPNRLGEVPALCFNSIHEAAFVKETGLHNYLLYVLILIMRAYDRHWLH